MLSSNKVTPARLHPCFIEAEACLSSQCCSWEASKHHLRGRHLPSRRTRLGVTWRDYRATRLRSDVTSKIKHVLYSVSRDPNQDTSRRKERCWPCARLKEDELVDRGRRRSIATALTLTAPASARPRAGQRGRSHWQCWNQPA